MKQIQLPIHLSFDLKEDHGTIGTSSLLGAHNFEYYPEFTRKRDKEAGVSKKKDARVFSE